MNDYVNPNDEKYPNCKEPEDLDAEIWHYMDFWKFEYLIEKKALYLCRADLQSDKFEGTYPHKQINGINEYLQREGPPGIIEDEGIFRRQNRQKTYISCWCFGKTDLYLMWKAYTQESPEKGVKYVIRYLINLLMRKACKRRSPGVAVKSTVRKLLRIRNESPDYRPLDLCTVTYIDHVGRQQIPYGMLDPFLHKDRYFEPENEVRLIYYPNIHLPSTKYFALPIRPEELITCVVLKPKSRENSLIEVQKLLDKHDFQNIQIMKSRNDRELLV